MLSFRPLPSDTSIARKAVSWTLEGGSALSTSAPLPADPCALPEPVEVLGLPIRPLNTRGLMAKLVNRARAGLRTTVHYANAHTANLAMANALFHQTLRDCDLLYADGASIVWASRWSRQQLPERMTSADYFPVFAQNCADTGLSLYLLGGRPGVADAAAQHLCRTIPDLRIAGLHHGYFDDAQSETVIETINASRPDVLIVGLSSPRQEYWVSRHAATLAPPVRWCVGALLDYLAGHERRAPSWLCSLGGEWLFRLLADPAGKWQRYLLGNPIFVWNTLAWAWRNGKENRNFQYLVKRKR